MQPMQPMQLFAASITIALAALGALPLAAQSQANSTDARAQEMLRRLLAAVVTQPLINAAFVERLERERLFAARYLLRARG